MNMKTLVTTLLAVIVAYTPLAADDYRDGNLEDEGFVNPRGRARLGEMDQQDERANEIEIRGMLRGMIVSALKGDEKNYILSLEPTDWGRMEEQADDGGLPALSEDFRERWRAQFDTDLISDLEQVELRANINLLSDGRTALARVSSDAGEIELDLARGGWLEPGWRVDISNDVSKRDLQSALRQSIAEVETVDLSGSKESACARIALKLLTPVGRTLGIGESITRT